MRSYFIARNKEDFYSFISEGFVDIIWESSRHGTLEEKCMSTILALVDYIVDSNSPRVEVLWDSRPIGNFYVLDDLVSIVRVKEPVYYK